MARKYKHKTIDDVEYMLKPVKLNVSGALVPIGFVPGLINSMPKVYGLPSSASQLPLSTSSGSAITSTSNVVETKVPDAMSSSHAFTVTVYEPVWV